MKRENPANPDNIPAISRLTSRHCASLLALVAVSGAIGCTHTTPVAESQVENSVELRQESVASSLPSQSVPAPSFNASRAMQYVKELVAYGPRPLGSENHKKVERYILTHLQGDRVEQDDFEITAREGRFPVHNIVAKFPGSREGIIVIASHYDTNWPLRRSAYIGANDGASSSGLLLELANQLRGKRRDGYNVWLLWDDAEESMRLPWVDAESLYGVRHLAQKWQEDGTIKKIKAFILEDMIGDSDLNIDRDTSSTSWLADLVYEAATRVGYQSHFFARQLEVKDDHRPFLERAVPAVDLIDFNYGYNNVFWHTTQDTIDKLSPKSLAIVGTVTLETVRLLDLR